MQTKKDVNIPQKNQNICKNPLLRQQSSIDLNTKNAVGSISETAIRRGGGGICTCNDYLRNRSPNGNFIPPLRRESFYSQVPTVRIDCERRKLLYSNEKTVLVRDENGKLQPRFVFC